MAGKVGRNSNGKKGRNSNGKVYRAASGAATCCCVVCEYCDVTPETVDVSIASVEADDGTCRATGGASSIKTTSGASSTVSVGPFTCSRTSPVSLPCRWTYSTGYSGVVDSGYAPSTICGGSPTTVTDGVYVEVTKTSATNLRAHVQLAHTGGTIPQRSLAFRNFTVASMDCETEQSDASSLTVFGTATVGRNGTITVTPNFSP